MQTLRLDLHRRGVRLLPDEAAREVMNRLQFLGGFGGLLATAAQYVVVGNFLFHGQEVLFA